jgi:nitroimidazol reductase NimA-like FMN-containing flavoprotein (pyridoxamine 5'-phosphate oxidase superfamily)
VAAYLAGSVRARVATVGKDGSPHVVPMSYVVLDGNVTFWADNLSQKVKNLQRDPRVSVIVDDGVDFQ